MLQDEGCANRCRGCCRMRVANSCIENTSVIHSQTIIALSVMRVLLPGGGGGGGGLASREYWKEKEGWERERKRDRDRETSAIHEIQTQIHPWLFIKSGNKQQRDYYIYVLTILSMNCFS